MRRRVVAAKHRNHDPQETRDLWHSLLGPCWADVSSEFLWFEQMRSSSSGQAARTSEIEVASPSGYSSVRSLIFSATLGIGDRRFAPGPSARRSAAQRRRASAGRCSGLFGRAVLRRMALLASITARSASFTAIAFGNAAATSGSSRTTLEPFRRRSAYLPRTPLRIAVKSYSARRSSFFEGLFFFIKSPLALCGAPCADDPDFRSHI